MIKHDFFFLNSSLPLYCDSIYIDCGCIILINYFSETHQTTRIRKLYDIFRIGCKRNLLNGVFSDKFRFHEDI